MPRDSAPPQDQRRCRFACFKRLCSVRILLYLQVLAANAAGTAVILTNHSNCERGFLPVLAAKFTAQVERLQAPGADSAAASSAGGAGGAAPPSAFTFECSISAVDADPLVTM